MGIEYGVRELRTAYSAHHSILCTHDSRLRTRSSYSVLPGKPVSGVVRRLVRTLFPTLDGAIS